MPLLVAEATTPALQRLYAEDPIVIAWWGAEIECVSAIMRLERGDDVTASGVSRALDRLDAIKASWSEVQPLSIVRTTARRLLRVHDLRAADALQLAAALAAAEDQPDTLEFLSLDQRLANAADREGFAVVRVR